MGKDFDESEVNGSHYKNHGVDLFELCRKGLLTQEEYVGALKFNIYKYIYRYDKKNGYEDLLKAYNYLNELIRTFEE